MYEQMFQAVMEMMVMRSVNLRRYVYVYGQRRAGICCPSHTSAADTGRTHSSGRGAADTTYMRQGRGVEGLECVWGGDTEEEVRFGHGMYLKMFMYVLNILVYTGTGIG